MKALKTLVLFLGVLLVLGFGFLIWGLTGRAAKIGTPSMSREMATNFGTVRIEIQPGAKLIPMALSENRMAVHVTGGPQDKLIILDTNTGGTIGQFTFIPAPAPSQP